MAEAGAQPIAKQVTQQSGFIIDKLDGAFRTVGDALPAAVAFDVVYLDNLSFHS
jgi:hypothetical protein